MHQTTVWMACCVWARHPATNPELSTDARGHYTVGKELIEQVLDKIRRVAGLSPLLSHGSARLS